MMIILSVGISLLAIALLALALRGRIVDRGAFCRKCRFDLAGLASDTPACPECGADLAAPNAARPTLRRRRPVVLALGILLLLAGGTLMGIIASNNTARVMAALPDRVVLTLHDMGWDIALTEIATNRLVRTNALSDETWNDLIADALAHQQDINTVWDPRHGEVLLQAFTRGRLSAEQIEQYFDLGFENTVEFSEEIRHGAEEVGVRVIRSSTGRVSALSGNFGQLIDPVGEVWNRIQITSVGVVDPAFTNPLSSAGWTGLSIPGPTGGGGSGSIGATIEMENFDWNKVEPGKEYEFFVEYEIQAARMSDDHVHYRTQQRATRPIRILPADANLVSLVSDPDIIAQFRDRSALRVSPIRVVPREEQNFIKFGPRSIRLGTIAVDLPIAVVGQAFVIHDGGEFHIGELSMTTVGGHLINSIDRTTTEGVDDDTLQQWLDAGQVTIEIRPDPRLAEQSPGVDRILGVPLRFEHVPVTDEDISHTYNSGPNPEHTTGRPVVEPPPESEPSPADG